MTVEIKFCGAAGLVTGSSYLVSMAGGKFLIDCGMFQGTKTVRELNYDGFGYDPRDVTFALLTHAHIDHSGLLPKLYRQGFRGKVYTTEATKDLLEYMLPDSASIQEMEVRRINTQNRQRGLPPVEPIYTQEDVATCLGNIAYVEMDGWADLPLGVKARFWNAGHILGAASIELKIPGADGREVHILFSGDIGPENKMFYPAPESPHDVDYLLVESTYGDRQRQDTSLDARRERLRGEILKSDTARGNIIIPAFAVERTQELLMDLDWLMAQSKIPTLPLFIDSPLATKVTGVFEKHEKELQDLSGPHAFTGRNIHYVQSAAESKGLDLVKSGAIIMSASGMCDAGRIRYHLRNNLWNPAATVLFVGYQAEGTLGRFLQQGQKKVRIFGEEISVRARIASIETYSAHADQGELLAWVKARLPVRKNIFVIHGTDASRQGMVKNLTAHGIPLSLLVTPSIDDRFGLDTAGAAEKLGDGGARITRVEMAAVSDWHNDYARFVLDLAERLRGMRGAEERRALLADLARHVSGAVGGMHGRG
ncbi:MAG: MBL fold metallo-hydrolase [Alphaproteobacteria bacterium]|nr:MBL fold metallo-hydrolase [Alphaproteobacteria bacterium]